MSDDGCGAPEQTEDPTAGVDLNTQVLLAGQVVSGGEPVGGAFVRLLNGNGDFAGEVVASESGNFRFFAAPGSWIVRALHRSGNGQTEVSAEGPGLHKVSVPLG
jgi:hypothetical protein